MKTLRTLILMILVVPCAAYAYGTNDDNDRLSGASSSVFSPGYINAAKQKTDAIVNQLGPNKSFMDKLVDNIKNGISGNVDKDANTKETVEVKKKTSTTRAQAPIVAAPTAPSSPIGNVVVGSGDPISKRYADSAGNIYLSWASDRKLVSEKIGEVTLVYGGNGTNMFKMSDGSLAGFSTLNDAINYASTVNGVVLAQQGDYLAFTLKSNVTVCGGYNNNGVRDTVLTPTNIMATIEAFNVTNASVDGVSSYVFKPSRWKLLDPFYLHIGNSTNVAFTNFQYDVAAGGGEIQISNSSVYFDTQPMEPYSPYSSNHGVVEIWNTNSTVNLTASAPVFNNTPLSDETSLNNRPTNISAFSSDYLLNMSDYNAYGSSPYDSSMRLSNNSVTKDATSGIFKNLLALADDMATGGGGGLTRESVIRLVENNLGLQGITMSLTDRDKADQISVALALANILKNPTEDQKLIIDAITSLLKDVSKVEGENGKSAELTKAENDLLQIVAGVLLAQGVPDLLKAGDVENMKGMFKDLGASKDKILLDYKESIRPYYSNIAKEIAANIAVLETKGIIKKKLTEEQLKKLEPREIDRIMETIRKSNDKSFELEYLLQQDSKYRKDYLEPSKKLMEDHMKTVLGSFAKKLSEALEEKR